MKSKLLTLLVLAAGVLPLQAQAPSGMNYQAALRNNAGAVLANQNVSLRFTIRDGGVAGSILFQETHNKSTNAQGLVTAIIGAGSLTQGAFPTAVQWGTGSKFLQVELDAAGGSSYTEISNAQVMAVPYSNFSGAAGALLPSARITPGQIQGGGATTGQVLKWDGSAWVPGSAGGSSGTVPLSLLEQGTATNGQIIRWNGVNWVPSNDGPTTLAPSQLTQESATNGQVLKWNGSIWAPAAIGNIAPSQISAGGATNGQVLKWDGTNWSPGTDNNSALTGGTGITISSGAINSVWTSNGNNIHNNNTGNVGIGTTSPASALEVVQTSGNAEIRARSGAATAYSGLRLGNSGGYFDMFRYGSSATGSLFGWPGKDLGILSNGNTGSLVLNANDSFAIATGAAERFRITPLGSSFGAVSPIAKLHIQGAGRTVIDIPHSAYFFSTPVYATGDTTGNNVAMPGLLGYGKGSSTFNAGIAGLSGNSGTFNVGALFEATAPAVTGKRNYGIYNSVSSGYTFTVGMFNNVTTATTSTSGNYGLYTAVGGTAAAITFGGYFQNTATNSSLTNYGVYATATSGATNFAGYFDGNVTVNGTLSKSGGTFQIDHPQDPENKYLIHSFVESPDMMNIYNGNITTDAQGYATVQMPDYFQSLNMEFRYQLTVMGADFAQAIVAEKIVDNHFKIRTDKPNTEVSWQVTGVRNDPWAQANRFVPERAKEANAKGKYLHPELYGQPANRGIHYVNKDGIEAPTTKVTR